MGSLRKTVFAILPLLLCLHPAEAQITPPALVAETSANTSGVQIGRIIRDNVTNSALYTTGKVSGNNSAYAVVQRRDASGGVIWEKRYGTNLKPDVTYDRSFEGANDVAVDKFGNPWAVITIVEARVFNNVTKNVPIVRLLKLNAGDGSTVNSVSSAGQNSQGAIAANQSANGQSNHNPGSLAINKSGDAYLIYTSLIGFNNVASDWGILKVSNNFPTVWHWLWDMNPYAPLNVVLNNGKTLPFTRSEDEVRKIALIGPNEEPVVYGVARSVYTDGTTTFKRDQLKMAQFSASTGASTNWDFSQPNRSGQTINEADYWGLSFDDAVSDPDGNSYVSTSAALLKINPDGVLIWWKGQGWPNVIYQLGIYADASRRREAWRIFGQSHREDGSPWTQNRVYGFRADSGDLAWEQVVSSPSGGDIYIKDLAVDVAGSPIILSAGPIGDGGKWESYFAKFDASGQFLWQFQHSPSNSTFHHGSSLALSPAGTIYVASDNATASTYGAIVSRYSPDPFAIMATDAFNITATSATVEWVANRTVSDYSASLGVFPSFSGFSSMNGSATPASSVRWTVSGLAPATRYGFQVAARETFSGPSVMATGTFITARPPVLAEVDPLGVTKGTSGVLLKVRGSYFTPQSKILFNGVERTTTYLSESELSTQLTSSDLTAAGQFPVKVTTPSAGTSAEKTFTVYEVTPSVASVTPDRFPQDYGTETSVTKLTVRGTNFIPGVTEVSAYEIHEGGGTIYIWGEDNPDTGPSNQSQYVRIVSSTEIEITAPYGLFDRPDIGQTKHYISVKNKGQNPASGFSTRYYVDPVTPQIVAITVSNVTTTGASIRLDTNLTGSIALDYGTTTAYGTRKTGGANKNKTASFDLTGLASGTTYYYRATLTNTFTGTTTRTGSFVTTKTNAAPKVTVTGATITRSGGTLSATVTVRNTGNLTATGLQITLGQLGSANTTTALPLSLPNLDPNVQTTFVLTFPNQAAGAAMLTLRGIYNGGGSVNAGLRVTVP